MDLTLVILLCKVFWKGTRQLAITNIQLKYMYNSKKTCRILYKTIQPCPEEGRRGRDHRLSQDKT